MILYAEPRWDSPYVFTALVALLEKGIEPEVRVLDLDAGAQREAGYARRSLTARVPSIEDGAFALSESLAIVEYLEEKFPAPAHRALLPAGLEARARARQVLGWLRSDLMPLRDERSTETMFYDRARAPLSPKARASADKLVRVATTLVPEGGGALFGEWCIADADLAFMLHRLTLNGDPVPEAMAEYATAQWRRPSVRRFVEWDRPSAG